MAYISVQEGLHGIRGLLAFRPETAKGIGLLTQELLQTDTGISKGEREIIAAYVSTLNNCFYCATSHAAIAKYHCNEDEAFVQKAINDPQNSDLSPKMKALMEIAKQVQQHGQNVKQHHIDTARSAGATDLELHDTVLIAALFCMSNRYVDGLGTFQPTDKSLYDANGKMRAKEGYLISIPSVSTQ